MIGQTYHMLTHLLRRTKLHFCGISAKNVQPESNHEGKSDKFKCPEGHSAT